MDPSSDSRRREDSSSIPDGVRNFCMTLQKRLRARNAYDLQVLYEDDFADLSAKHFKGSRWPSAHQVASLFDGGNDALFQAFYRELYYRHAYAKLRVSVEERIDSFHNYIQLFNLLLAMRTDAPDVDLPASWLWDIIDEFAYQFEAFHQFRASAKDLAADEQAALRASADVWSPPSVIRALFSLVKKAQLDKPAAPSASDEPLSPLSDKDDDDDELGDDELLDDEKVSDSVGQLFKALGHFALIGLSRVNCFFGDYASALKVLDPIDLKKHKRNLFNSVAACHVSLYYYMGFAYMMLRRYTDAVKVFSSFVLFTTRSKARAKAYQTGLVEKRVDKILGLLSIVASITGHRLDEALQNTLRDKFGDRLQRLQKGDTDALKEAFLSACPKFLTLASSLNDDVAADEGVQLQLQIFLSEMQSRQQMADIYSYLKLCTTVSSNKLATFLGTDEETCISWLLALKNKSKSLRWKGGSPISGDWVSSADIGFFLSKDTIHVTEYRAPRQFGSFFIRQILKFQDTLHYLESSNANNAKHK